MDESVRTFHRLTGVPLVGVSVTDQSSPETTGSLTVRSLAVTAATWADRAVVVLPLVFDSAGVAIPDARAMIVIVAPLRLIKRLASAARSAASDVAIATALAPDSSGVWPSTVSENESPVAGVGMVTFQASVATFEMVPSGSSVVVTVKSPPASLVSSRVPPPRSVTVTPPTPARPVAMSVAVLLVPAWKVPDPMVAFVFASARFRVQVPASPAGANVTVCECAVPATAPPVGIAVTTAPKKAARLMSRTSAAELMV